MATTIITISNPRPIKVFAFLLCFISVFLMIVSVASSNWVYSGDGWREGLFERCAFMGTPTPLPFGMKPILGCVEGRSTAYIYITATLLLISLFTDFIGTVLTGLGLKSSHPIKKYMYYRFAIVSLIIALITIAAAVAIYPIYFCKDLAIEGNNPPLDGCNVTRVNAPSERVVASPAKFNVTTDGDGEVETNTDDSQLHSEGFIPDVAHKAAESAIATTCDDDGSPRDPQDFSYGFGYGFACVCLIFLFMSVGFLICDCGSEEIYYKDVPKEEEEVEEERVEEEL